jgi:hypothetical protein
MVLKRGPPLVPNVNAVVNRPLECEVLIVSWQLKEFYVVPGSKAKVDEVEVNALPPIDVPKSPPSQTMTYGTIRSNRFTPLSNHFTPNVLEFDTLKNTCA